MAQQPGLLHGSYALEIGGTKSSTGGGSKATQELKLNDFVMQEDKLPDTINGFDTKKRQYYAEKSKVEMAEAVFNVQLQSSFMSDYGGNASAFWQDMENQVLNANLQIIQQKNQLLEMHNSIEQEWNEFKEGDLYNMESSEVLYDEIGDPMASSSLLSEDRMVSLYSRNPGLLFGMLGIDPSTLPNDIKGDPAAVEEWMNTNKKNVPVTRGMYMQFQDAMRYGQDFKNVDGIDTGAYIEAMHETMKGYGETVIGKDGGKHIIKTSGEQIQAGLDYFHSNIVENNPTLRRTRTAMLGSERQNEVSKFLNGSQDQQDTWGQDFAMLGDILEATGYDNYENLFYKNAEILEAVKKTGNQDWIAMMSSPEKIRNSLYYGDVKEGGVLSSSIKSKMFVGNLKQRERTILESLYDVSKDGKNKQVQTAMQKARGGVLDGYARIKKDIVTNDQAAEITQEFMDGTLETMFSYDAAFNNNLDYIGNKIVNPDEFTDEKFFAGKDNGVTLNRYVLAKTKGAVLDRFIDYAKNSDLAFKSLSSGEGKAGLKFSGISDVVQTRTEMGPDGKPLARAGNAILGNRRFIDPSETSSFNVLGEKWYTSEVVLGGKFHTGPRDGLGDLSHVSDGRRLSLQQLMQTDEFKEWIDKPENSAMKGELYNINTYMAGYYDTGDPKTNVTNLMNMQVQKHAKGNYTVEMRDVSKDSKYSPITGEPLIKGLTTSLNPITLEEELMPISGMALGVDAIIRGYNPNNRSQQYAMTWMAIPKESAEDWEMEDKEGNIINYAELFGEDEFEMEELLATRPDLLANFITPGMKSAYDRESIKSLLEEYQIISVPIKIDNSYWDNSLINKKLDLPNAATQQPAVTNSEFSTALGYSVTTGG